MQLEAALDKDLCCMATEEGLVAITDLWPWMTKIKAIDNCCQLERKHMADFWDQRSAKCQNTNVCLTVFSSTTHTVSTCTNPSMFTLGLYPPKLMEDERQLLLEHKGCLKC